MREISIPPIPLDRNIAFYAGDGQVRMMSPWRYRDTVVNLELTEHNHRRGPAPTISQSFGRMEINDELVRAIYVKITCRVCRPVPRSEIPIPDSFCNLLKPTTDLPNELY